MANFAPDRAKRPSAPAATAAFPMKILPRKQGREGEGKRGGESGPLSPSLRLVQRAPPGGPFPLPPPPQCNS